MRIRKFLRVKNDSSQTKFESRDQEWDESFPWESQFWDREESLAEVCNRKSRFKVVKHQATVEPIILLARLVPKQKKRKWGKTGAYFTYGQCICVPLFYLIKRMVPTAKKIVFAQAYCLFFFITLPIARLSCLSAASREITIKKYQGPDRWLSCESGETYWMVRKGISRKGVMGGRKKKVKPQNPPPFSIDRPPSPPPTLAARMSFIQSLHV